MNEDCDEQDDREGPPTTEVVAVGEVDSDENEGYADIEEAVEMTRGSASYIDCEPGGGGGGRTVI